MPAVKTKRISTLIETQLPQFISSEYELFSKFVQKYYEAQEVQGGTLDIISNIQKYADIDFYEKSLLKQNDVLVTSISDSDTTIVLQDAQSFPQKNGFVRIDDEIIFYAKRTDTELLECSRGVSGNTTLGDLYNESNFVSTDAASHNSGQTVYNVSNLFLYALVRNFESQYLGSFPEKYLKGEVDKRTLIKNIQKFYKAKGTSSSIKFIFNTIVAQEASNKPEVYKPKDYTYKSSNADWINIYALKCKVISGNVNALVGNPIVQTPTDEYGYASATVDNVYADGTRDDEKIYNIVVAPETVNGEFFVSTKTKLTKSLSGIATTGNRINVFSTLGWDKTGSILIGNETITFDKKNATQFIIKSRQPSGAIVHPVNTPVYKPVVISGSGVSLLVLGIIYNMSPTDAQPYSDVGDAIQVSNPGFITADPKIVLSGTNQSRWLFGNGAPVIVPTLPSVAASLNEVPTDVTSLYEDEQYYYVTSSSFPSHKILDGSTVNQTLLDQQILRLIRKEAITTTERYKTPKADTGILLNGVRTYSYRDTESVRFGRLEQIQINTQGRGYAKPPFVLVDEVPNKARAVLSGQVVERIIVDTKDIFPKTPEITITSGRRAEVRAVVTGGKVTSLIIDNPGEYYSSPPLVRIRDNAGRGRFANYEAIINGDGKITGFTKIDEGNFYNQNTVIVDIIAVGEGASGIPLLREWNFNRYEKLKNELDTENGYIFQNYNQTLEYGYGYVANPKALRVAVSDNLDNAGSEPTNKVHSPIIGFAYDGNPIYGPFGHQNPLDPQSPIVRMTSGYSIKNSRSEGPSVKKYPLGSFVDDYRYVHRSGSLDENNGRFCITPDYPEGTYAYFVTIDENQVPKFPYIIGANFYSLPIDSNYNSDINQNDIPKKAKRYYLPGIPRNGEGLIATISDVSSGTIDNVDIVRSSGNFSVNCKVYFDNKGTEGSEVEANVASVKGRSVSYLQSKETKVVKLTTIQTAYLFADDTLRQPSSGANGKIVGTVANDNVIVLREVNGTFDNTGTFSADIKTFSLLLDQDSSYTEGATLSLTDGINPPIATAEVLEGTNRQNVVKIKVLTGTWDIDSDYFIQSSNLFNTIGSRIVTLTSLSDNLEPFDVNQSVALVETADAHGLGIGDDVDINIIPDDTAKTKTYYLRKRLYQEATLIAPKVSRKIEYTGIGRYQILNGGADYTPGVYNNVPLTGGSGSGATASITVSNAGVVSSITLQSGGSGYKKADYLSVDDESLIRSIASLGNQRLTLYIDHVGFASGSTKLILDSGIGFAEGDLISIGEEVLEVSSISGNTLTVLRGREQTQDKDHYDGQVVSLYKPRYNFDPNFQIFSGSNSGYIQSYDRDTQTIVIIYDYATQISTANEVTLSSNFFDDSVPSRPVRVRRAGDLDYKFEFSEDNTNFVPNPNINLQEFYRYVFDTSHSSLTGTYFDMSPSRSYNLETVEKIASSILPGNPGSFTDVKFGFGPRLSTNNYQNKIGTRFTNFYYFDRKGIVNSDGSAFKIVSDPLQGTKKVTYVTPTRFVYDVPSEPLWDGSGSISYTTSGRFAIGEINSFAITNLGLNYKKLPPVVGVDPNPNYKASATVLFDLSTKTITGVRIDDIGSNYTNAKVIITNSDGIDATFKTVVRNGEIFSITVDNPGSGYTFAPDIEIVEADLEAYAESTTVGVPRSVSIINNGGAFHLDKTVSSTFNSKFVFALSNFSGNFRKGETIIQVIDGVEVARAVVSEWRFGSNLLKVDRVTGIFRENQIVKSSSTPTSGTIKSIFVSTFTEEIVGFYDNIGYYKSDRGKLGVSNQKILDSFFYQDYSYVVKSKTPIDQWRDLIKSTTHPAGFKLFGQVDIEATADVEMPIEMPKASHFSVIQLWDPEKNKITVENTRRVITQTIQKVENQRIRRGVGSAATSEFLFNELRAFEVSLDAAFDGYYDGDGKLQGTTSFQLLDDRGLPFTPFSDKNLIVTLDGILQEPGVAYIVSADRIIFSQPPLGPYQAQTGEAQSDVTTYRGVTFYAKYIAFKDNQYNVKHFRKIRNIFQRNGRWLDAANQIERNRQFIVEETIGYAKQKYPTLDWSTKQDDYEVNIGAILDAYEHDLRFGGNIKTVDYTSIFNEDADYLYIQNNRSQSAGIFEYATRLAKLSIRNWDYTDTTVRYIQGSAVMTVTDTDNLAIGMFVSSGRAYPSGTYIVSIDSDTQITLSNSALANSAGGGGAPQGSTSLSGEATSQILPTNTGVVAPGNTYSVPPGVTVGVPTSFSGNDQATFYWSGINNGTFYDAANLIQGNKTYIQEETIAWAQSTYPSINWNSKGAKCERDLGFLVDAYVYHLRFGGNQKVVEFGQFYYDKAKYPDGENLLFVNNELTESLAAFEYAKDLMVQAMRNNLPYNDPSILTDTQVPQCAEVESALDNFNSIVNTILTEGRGLVEITNQNPNKDGNWSRTLTYSNYNIIGDPLLLSQECNDVISSVNSLFDNISDVLQQQSVDRTLPDYIDGETKIFELYWEDGSEVIVEEDEDLFLTINAVLQRPKYTENYPLFDAYYIDRSVVPNLIKFDVAPIWDQDFSAKSIGEPTAVEKISGVGVGNYKRLTIDYDLVDGVRSGPFLILDVEDKTVQNVESKDNLYVFLDGVLQREGYSYTISGPNIYFNVSIQKEMQIDMRYLYGRDVGQILNIYDFSPDTYFARGKFVLEGIPQNIKNQFIEYKWMGDKVGSPIHVWQQRPDGTYNVLGEVSNLVVSGNTFNFDIKSQNGYIEEGLDFTFAVKGRYTSKFTILDANITASSLDYVVDDNGRKLLRDDNALWYGTIIGKSYRNPFVYLAQGDKIRVEGEDAFRSIKQLPEIVTSKDGRDGEQLTDDIYGSVSIETYTGITRGEGLSVVAIVENGSIVRLEWNQRSWEPLTQPTAYQYFTPPVLNFIPANGVGGGARANVLVDPLRGQVLSVDLLDGGSGYTEAPLVVVSRRYDILTERDIGVSLINIGVNPYVETAGLSVISTIDVVGNQVSGINTFTSIVFNSPIDTSRKITAEIQLLREAGDQLEFEREFYSEYDTNADDVKVIDVFYEATVLSAQIQDVVSTNSISTVSRTITTTLHNVINNTALSNINYFEVAALLQVDLDPTDTVVYIADTSKFDVAGYLLIGNEVVRYMRKINDRFLMVLRGENNTIAQFWPAGTYIRQIPDPVSVAIGGIVTIESESDVSMVSVPSGTSTSSVERDFSLLAPPHQMSVTRVVEQEINPEINVESISTVSAFVFGSFSVPFDIVPSVTVSTQRSIVNAQIQTIQSEFTVTKNQLEVLLFTPPSGVIDGYEEQVFITDPVIQRNGNAVDLISIGGQYFITQRNLTEVLVTNSVFGIQAQYIGSYEKTNLGHTISHYDGIFDDGTANASGLTLLEFSTYFPSMTIRDFTLRANSSYTLSGAKFNLMPPSIQNPVTISSSTGTIGGPIVVQNTDYFPVSGY
ncbi:MAG: YHYH protein, partial [Candidatus Nanopelagicaceae bacterium]